MLGMITYPGLLGNSRISCVAMALLKHLAMVLLLTGTLLEPSLVRVDMYCLAIQMAL